MHFTCIFYLLVEHYFAKSVPVYIPKYENLMDMHKHAYHESLKKNKDIIKAKKEANLKTTRTVSGNLNIKPY